MTGRRLPYRGDGFPTNFQPRKWYVNLRQLRWSLTKTILVIIAIFGIITFFVLRAISNSGTGDITSYIIALFLIWMLPLVVIASILDLNKFRKGRDVDISDEHIEKTENPAGEP